VNGDEIDILTDVVGSEERSSRIRERRRLRSHEQVIVLDTQRPVLSETIVETGAGHGAPGRPTSKQIEEATDQWAFLVRALGIKWAPVRQ
jgi:hypothetical protein